MNDITNLDDYIVRLVQESTTFLVTSGRVAKKDFPKFDKVLTMQLLTTSHNTFCEMRRVINEKGKEIDYMFELNQFISKYNNLLYEIKNLVTDDNPNISDLDGKIDRLRQSVVELNAYFQSIGKGF